MAKAGQMMARVLGVPATQHTVNEKLKYHLLVQSGKVKWNDKLN